MNSKKQKKKKILKNILLVDDHSIVRKGLISIIEDSDLDCKCFEASDKNEAMTIMKNNEIDFVVLDISLKDSSGFIILDRIKRYNSKIKTLMISVLSEDIYADKSIKSGANGFIPKEAAPEELIIAIKKISDGKLYLSDSITNDIVMSRYFGNPKEKTHEDLSERESDILLLTAKGLKTIEIAEALFLNSNTVNTYKSRIKKKLGLKTNMDMIRYCVNNKLC